MPELQQIPLPMRPETGAMRFASDWPGLFIRGDDCIALQQALATILNSSGLIEDESLGPAAAKLEEICEMITNQVIV